MQVMKSDSESHQVQFKLRFKTQNGVVRLEFRGWTTGTRRASPHFLLALNHVNFKSLR